MAHVPAAERRPQLVRAAIELMTREGVAAGSTRAIATELGVAQATVHYTFGTKTDLYRAVVEQLTADFIDRVRHVPTTEGGFADVVRTLARALWQSVLAESGRALLLDEFAILALREPELLDVMRGYQREIERAAAEIITSIADATDQRLALPAEDVAAYFLAGFDGLHNRHRLLAADEQDSARLLDELVAATLDMCV